MNTKKSSTPKESKNNIDSSFIDFLRELGFTTGAEALERHKREQIAEFIRFKEQQDNVTDDIKNTD